MGQYKKALNAKATVEDVINLVNQATANQEAEGSAMTPLVGLLVGLVVLVALKACCMCYAWGFRDGRNVPPKYLGLGIQVDRRVPPDRAYFVDGRGVLVGNIKGIGNAELLKKYTLQDDPR